MTIIDVRTKEEFNQGAVPGALHHDIMDMMSGIFPNISKEEEVILYCESGNRAMMAKNMMEDMGFKNVKNGGSLEECLKIINS